MSDMAIVFAMGALAGFGIGAIVGSRLAWKRATAIVQTTIRDATDRLDRSR